MQAELDNVADVLERIRQRAPLVHNITNVVVTNFSANVLLAVGASPAMIESPDEAADFVAIADALVVNLGTLSPHREAAMIAATRRAVALGKPWVLDPVGVGATPHRSWIAATMVAGRPSVIRGNASEIRVLAGQAARGRGVDSADRSESAIQAARELAQTTGAVVAVTGAVDYVTDGAQVIGIANGHPLMTRVTGTGCSATAVIGACLAVEPSPLRAAVAGLALFALAGEQAAAQATGPGSLAVSLLDRLHLLTATEIQTGVRLVS